MKEFFTEDDVRKALRERLQTVPQAAMARKVGVGAPFISMIANGAPPTGKVLKFLGFSKVRQRLYTKIRRSPYGRP